MHCCDGVTVHVVLPGETARVAEMVLMDKVIAGLERLLSGTVS